MTKMKMYRKQVNSEHKFHGQCLILFDRNRTNSKTISCKCQRIREINTNSLTTSISNYTKLTLIRAKSGTKSAPNFFLMTHPVIIPHTSDI